METTTEHLLDRARDGEELAIGALLERYRPRLRRVVALRLDDRLRGRFDEDDVLQDACVEAMSRIQEYFRGPIMPFYLWLRFLTVQRMQALCRENLGIQKRDVRKERPLDAAPYSATTSKALAAQLVGKWTTPSEAILRLELKARLRNALDTMDPLDREIIALRHFEQLSNGEAAQVLGIKSAAASKRYIRAVQRLKEILASVGGVSGTAWM
jgi:RNA polymerase sigma-70 factor (ECF subfamily)